MFCPHIGLNIIGVSSKGTFDMKCVLNYDDMKKMKSISNLELKKLNK